MATSQPEIAFVVNARDKATAIFDKVSKSSNLLGATWRSLVGLAARLNVAMLALSVTLPIVAAAFASLLTVTTAISFVRFERAMRRTRIQLQLLGLSAIQARSQVATLAGMMDRAAATSFFNSAEAINTVAIAGFELTKQLIPLATEFAELTGLDPAAVFVAMFDAVAKHDADKFALLVTGMTNLAIPMEVLASLEAGDVEPFLKFLADISSTESVTGLEKVADSLERIAELTRPTREAVVNTGAILVNVLLESIATRLEEVGGELEEIFLVAWAAALLTTGRSMGMRLGTGIAVGMAGILLVDFITTLEKVGESPVITAGILAIGLGLGRQLGGRKGGIVGGILIIMGLELLPGLQDMFNDLRFSQQLEVSAFALGVTIGLLTKQGFFRSFALGSVLQTVVGDFNADKNAAQTTTVIGFTAIGAILGARFGGGFQGAIVGSLIGNLVGTILADPATDKLGIELGKTIGTFILDGILGVLVELPIAIANLVLEGINNALANLGGLQTPFGTIPLPGVSVPLIPNPVPDILDNVGGGGGLPGPTDFADVINTLPTGGGSTSTVPSMNDFFSDFRNIEQFGEGGVIPGPLGAPRMAVVHGGETVIPGSGNIVIQLVLDKRVIGEVAVDAVNKVARFNAGMVPGSVGS